MDIIEAISAAASSEAFVPIISVFIGAEIVYLLYKFWFVRSLPYEHRTAGVLKAYVPRNAAFVFYYVLFAVILFRNLWNNFVSHTGNMSGLLFTAASGLFILIAAADKYEDTVRHNLSHTEQR